MAAALAAGAADYVMPDLERIGGVTGWQRAAALAAAHRIEMSSHLFPEVSVHLLAATPTCHFLEYVDWADKILAEPLEIVDGFAVALAPAGQWARVGPEGGREIPDRVKALAWPRTSCRRFAGRVRARASIDSGPQSATIRLSDPGQMKGKLPDVSDHPERRSVSQQATAVIAAWEAAGRAGAPDPRYCDRMGIRLRFRVDGTFEPYDRTGAAERSGIRSAAELAAAVLGGRARHPPAGRRGEPPLKAYLLGWIGIGPRSSPLARRLRGDERTTGDSRRAGNAATVRTERQIFTQPAGGFLPGWTAPHFLHLRASALA